MKVIKSYKNLASPLTLPYLVINSHDVTEHVGLVREHLQATYKPVGKFYKSGQPQRHVLVSAMVYFPSEKVLFVSLSSFTSALWFSARFPTFHIVGSLQPVSSFAICSHHCNQGCRMLSQAVMSFCEFFCNRSRWTLNLPRSTSKTSTRLFILSTF